MLTLAAAVLAATSVAGDAPSGWPVAGEKVRVTMHAGRSRETGVVVRTGPEILTVATGAGPSTVRIPVASIDRLEVARGRRTAAKEGAILGGVVGAVLGGLAAAALGEALCENATNCGTSAEGYLVLVAGFGAAGAGVGALTGLAIKKDRWERVAVNRVRVGVGIRPVPVGAALQVSVGWGGR